MNREERRRRDRDREVVAGSTPAEVEAAMTDVLRQAGVDPAVVYAFQQTGFVLTEANRDRFCREDLRAWAEAIARYEALHS